MIEFLLLESTRIPLLNGRIVSLKRQADLHLPPQISLFPTGPDPIGYFPNFSLSLSHNEEIWFIRGAYYDVRGDFANWLTQFLAYIKFLFRERPKLWRLRGCSWL
jgi:hypothetical protein